MIMSSMMRSRFHGAVVPGWVSRLLQRCGAGPAVSADLISSRDGATISVGKLRAFEQQGPDRDAGIPDGFLRERQLESRQPFCTAQRPGFHGRAANRLAGRMSCRSIQTTRVRNGTAWLGLAGSQDQKANGAASGPVGR